MRKNVTSVRLCCALSHQPGLGTSTVFTSASRLLSTKGPVPLALRVAKFSSRFVRSAAVVAPFFSAQALDMMPQPVISSGRMGFGACVSISTVRSSILRASFTDAKYDLMFEPPLVARVNEKTTSSAVNGAPSWNLTLARSLKRQTVGEAWVHSVASAGSRRRSPSRRISGS
jgi:hypothetical protein